jgi:hypothetical protein
LFQIPSALRTKAGCAQWLEFVSRICTDVLGCGVVGLAEQKQILDFQTHAPEPYIVMLGDYTDRSM